MKKLTATILDPFHECAMAKISARVTVDLCPWGCTTIRIAFILPKDPRLLLLKTLLLTTVPLTLAYFK